MKLFSEDVAMRVVETLLTSDQRELIEKADAQRIKTVKAMAIVAFDIGEAFVEEAKKRGKK